LVIELVRGIELGTLLKQRGEPSQPIADAVDYLGQLWGALRQQIVHRDVKPQNMIVSDHGIVLVDFGIAREVDEDQSPGTVAIDTPRFMRPEVFAGGQGPPDRCLRSRCDTVDAARRARADVCRANAPLGTRPGRTARAGADDLCGLEMILERRVGRPRRLRPPSVCFGEDRGE
jgi:serine/threonine protein kinase